MCTSSVPLNRRGPIRCLLAVPLTWLWIGSGALAAPTILDFEDLPAGTTVTAQYGPRGVVFQQHFIDTDAAARSGTRVLRTVPPASEVFTAIPLVMTFTGAQARVKLFAGSRNVAVNGTLIAFDSEGAIVAQDGPRLVAADVFTTLFEVIDADAAASIVRAELRLDNAAHFAIDDLEFEGEPPAPPPPSPPVVQITTPVPGAELDVSTLDIAGTVTGEGLISPVKLTMTFARPPEQTVGPFTSDLALTGAGTTQQFSLPGFAGVPLGPISITVEAENVAAQKGSATVMITNLPVSIRNRFTAEGGASALGAFRFGLVADGCRIAVYEQAAISTDDAGVTRVIRGQILVKWLALRGDFDSDGIGCPLAEERDGLSGSRAQDFQEGRIYSHPTIGTFSVPTVFVDAIDKRGGEEAAGIPIAEPTSSPGVMQTWLFQQFTRPDHPNLVPVTLEIRGTPPTLWIERQPSNLRVPTTGTIYEEFPCSGTLGPCAVDPTPPLGAPIPDPGNTYCEGTTYPFGPPEWVPILDHYVSTPLFGVAVESALASVDNPFTHEYVYEINCPLKVDCPSDWTVAIHAVGPPRGIAPFTSYVAENTYVELEYEQYYAQAVHIFLDWPLMGDLFFTAGRWIIDCGHTPYRSELHPVFMWAKMKSEQFQGHLATRCDIWVNGWYPGDPIEFDIFPPPRPTPDATLTVVKPVDEDAAFNVNVEFAILPAGTVNHAHVRFTAPERRVKVTDAGEMIWETRRGYWGQWFLYWSE
jgi:hypothetical protein